MNTNKIIKGITILLIGLAIGWLVKPASSESNQANEGITMEETKATIWTCSMDPQVRQPEPGKCPICGMDLIPLDSGDDDDDPTEIKMSPTAMQLANIQTMIIGTGSPIKEVRVNGKVQADERLIYSQASHLEGRVEQLAINFTGEPVSKGQRIASIYSPNLVTAQEELFSARKIKDSQPALFEASKQKLKNWKLTDEQVEQIAKSDKAQENFPILADVNGIVLDKMVNLGDYVMRGMPLYKVVDLSKVWVQFDVYENDMPWVRVGSTVDFTVQSLPGQKFSARIVFIDPIIDPMNRVAKARVEINNSGAKLKPEMFATGIVKTQIGTKGKELMAPKSAVLWTGERSVVYVKISDERGVRFTMKEVELGPLTAEGFLIKKGLDSGTEIAVNGAFSIDAAAQLAGKRSMMNPEGHTVKLAHDHGTNTAATLPKVELNKQAKSALIPLFDNYFKLKDALVQSNNINALKVSKELKATFDKIDMSLFIGDAHNHWMNHSGEAIKELNKIASSKNVDESRKIFKTLSAQMVSIARVFGPFESSFYIQHCPMADNNSGADWLSLDKEIKNPYFGDKMLKCGKTTETIK